MFTELNKNDIHQFAPAAFATSAYNRKENYHQFPTEQIIDVLGGQGFVPVSASQVKVRKNREQRINFVKHALVFREANINEQSGTSGQIVVVNSHDGSTSYRLYFGLYRFVCANGLIVGEHFASQRVCHTGENTIDRVIDITRTFADNAESVNNTIEHWNNLYLEAPIQRNFVQQALELKFGKENQEIIRSYDPEKFLEAHNTEDFENNTLWSVFNKVQENIMKGGVTRRMPSGRIGRTRGIKNIDKGISLNQGLWNLASQFAEMVG